MNKKTFLWICIFLLILNSFICFSVSDLKSNDKKIKVELGNITIGKWEVYNDNPDFEVEITDNTKSDTEICFWMKDKKTKLDDKRDICLDKKCEKTEKLDKIKDNKNNLDGYCINMKKEDKYIQINPIVQFENKITYDYVGGQTNISFIRESDNELIDAWATKVDNEERITFGANDTNTSIKKYVLKLESSNIFITSDEFIDETLENTYPVFYNFVSQDTKNPFSGEVRHYFSTKGLCDKKESECVVEISEDKKTVLIFFKSAGNIKTDSITTVEACGTITTAGDYILEGNITSTGHCLKTTAPINLDCQGYSIIYGGSGRGLELASNDINISNCNIYSSFSNNGFGVYSTGDRNKFENVSTSGGYIAFFLLSPNNNVFNNIYINRTGTRGFTSPAVNFIVNNMTIDNQYGYPFWLTVGTGRPIFNNVNFNNSYSGSFPSIYLYRNGAGTEWNNLTINNGNNRGIYIHTDNSGFDSMNHYFNTVNINDVSGYHVEVLDAGRYAKNNTFINAFYNTERVFGAQAQLTRIWSWSGNVSDDELEPLLTNFSILDKNNNIIHNVTSIRDSVVGLTEDYYITQYLNSAGTKILYTPHTFLSEEYNFQGETVDLPATFQTLVLANYSYGLTDCVNYSITNVEYHLLNNISFIGTCLNFSGNNITLNGNGYSLIGSSGVNDNAIYIHNGYLSNINDLNIINSSTGIYNDNFDNSYINNVSLSNIIDYGIKSFESSSININNSVFNNANNSIILNYSNTFNLNNLILENNLQKSTGIHIFESNDGSLDNININNYNISLLFEYCSNIDLINLNLTNNNYGIYSLYGNNNLVENSFLSSSSYDVFLKNESTYNEYLNTTYISEYTDSSSELLRQWYYQVFINDTNGNILSNANITQYFKNSIYKEKVTNAFGYSDIFKIIVYSNTNNIPKYQKMSFDHNSRTKNILLSTNDNSYDTFITIDKTVPEFILYTPITGSSLNEINLNYFFRDYNSNISSIIDFNNSLISYWKMNEITEGDIEEITLNSDFSVNEDWSGYNCNIENNNMNCQIGICDMGIFSQQIPDLNTITPYNLDITLSQVNADFGFSANVYLGGNYVFSFVDYGGEYVYPYTFEIDNIYSAGWDNYITVEIYDMCYGYEDINLKFDKVELIGQSSPVIKDEKHNVNLNYENIDISNDANFQNSVNFDGSYNSKLTNVGDLDLSNYDEITLNTWIKPLGIGYTGIDYQNIFSMDSNRISIRQDNVILFYLKNINNWVTTTGGINVNDNNWHMLTFTYDGEYQKFYVDGIYKSQNYIVGDLAGSGTLTIGQFVNGSMDDTTLYNKALNIEEIKLLYSNYSSKNISLILNELYDIEEGNYTIKIYNQDNAGNTNDSELINFSYGKDRNITNITTSYSLSNICVLNQSCNVSFILVGENCENNQDNIIFNIFNGSELKTNISEWNNTGCVYYSEFTPNYYNNIFNYSFNYSSFYKNGFFNGTIEIGYLPNMSFGLIDGNNNNYSNFTNIIGQVNNNLYFNFSNFDLYKINNYSLIINITDVIYDEILGLNNTNYLYNFKIDDYDLHNYTIEIKDYYNVSNYFNGQLKTTNIAPNITNILSYRGMTPNSCIVGTNCKFRINIIEDGCDLSSHNINISYSNMFWNNSNISLVYSDKNNICIFETSNFLPEQTGSFLIESFYTDVFLNISSFSKYINIQNPTSGSSSYPTISIDDISINITPMNPTFKLYKGENKSFDFKIINLNQKNLNINIFSDNAEIFFLNNKKEINFDLDKEQVITYNIKLPELIETGYYNYSLLFNIDDNLFTYDLTVYVAKSYISNIYDFLNINLFDGYINLGQLNVVSDREFGFNLKIKVIDVLCICLFIILLLVGRLVISKRSKKKEVKNLE